MPIAARRPWGLIVVVLLIDIGLAVAGSWMLMQGLGGKPSAGSAPPRSGANATTPNAVAAGTSAVAAGTSAVAAGTSAVAPAEPRTTAASTGAASGAPAGAGSKSGGQPPGEAAAPGADRPAKRQHATAKKPGGTTTARVPVDPYETPAPRAVALPAGPP